MSYSVTPFGFTWIVLDVDKSLIVVINSSAEDFGSSSKQTRSLSAKDELNSLLSPDASNLNAFVLPGAKEVVN